MNLQSIVALGAFFILLGYRDVASSNMMDDDLFCGYSDADEDFCSSYCYKSVKPPLNYIIELKDQIKANAQEHLDSHREIKEIRRKLLDINNYRDHIEDLRKSNDHLRKTNDILMESVRWNNNHNEDMCKDNKLKAEKDLSESIAKQDQQIFNKCKRILNNLLNEKDNVIKNLKKELKDHQTKEENFKNEIEQLKLQLQSYQDTSPKIPETIAKTGCQDLSSGIHRITIPGLDPFSALCNGEIDGGDWLVIEKRFDGSENFYRNWTEYRNGFGKLDGEFFIGLEKLHRITNSNTYELYIQLTYFDGADEFAHYNNFRIANENEKYKLLTVGNFSGTTGNRLQYDQDNEQDKNLNWAVESHGGWWYRNMYDGINLNGRYYESQIVAVDSMSWYLYESLKGVQMLIRPKS